MKKTIVLGMALVAALASCTQDYKDWSSPQSNTASEAAEKLTMTVQPTLSSILFADDNGESVQLFTTNLAEGQVGNYQLDIAGTESEQTVELTATPDGMVATSQLAEAVSTIYGKRPVERKLYITVSANVKVTTADGVVSVQRVASPFELKATPDAPFIDSGYWLTGDFAGWNKEGALPFTHVGSGDIYENPEFQIVFETTAADQYWKIIPNGNYEGDFWAESVTGVVGTTVDGDTSTEGNLTTTGPQAGKIAEPGIYRMTINMMNYTYTIEKQEYKPYICFIGATDGWNNDEPNRQRLALTDDSGIYTGYLYCADPNGWGNEFKFQKTPGDWGTEVNFGMMTGGVTGDFAEGGGGNFKATAGEGVYYVTLDMAAMSISAVKVEKMGIIGDFNGWGGDVEMTWNATDYCFEATNAGVNANGWKFRLNGGWDINLGANDSVEPSTNVGDLVANGKNLGVVGNTIKLYPTRKGTDNIYCTVE